MHFLITGATGFVGDSLLQSALLESHIVSAIARKPKIKQKQCQYPQANWFEGELSAQYNWQSALSGVDCVVHCAARVHQMQDAQLTNQDIQQAYDEANFHATLNLAKQAAESGVKRFVFVSSIKVNGESTQPNAPFLPQTTQAPTDPYGLSKYKAEQALLELAAESEMDVVIVRPPLVYGPEVKANFQTMMKWASRPVPLPLGAINNQRSMVYIQNLTDLLLLCAHHPQAANQIFLVSDDYDISTSQLLKQIKQVSQSHCMLLPIPTSWFNIVAKVINKPQIAQRLCGSLQVDIRHTKNQLNWKPPVSWEQGIEETVKHYLQSVSGKTHS